jgi:uncharacterized membrane protein
MSSRSKKDRRIIKQEDSRHSQTEYSITAAFRQGPLPPPAELEKYENLYPGATKLLFDNFMIQSKHRMDLEMLTIQRDAKRADRGQMIAAILCIMVLAPSIVLLFLGKELIGLTAIIGSLATLAGTFFGGGIPALPGPVDRGRMGNPQNHGPYQC